jgi:hypothetical protein
MKSTTSLSATLKSNERGTRDQPSAGRITTFIGALAPKSIRRIAFSLVLMVAIAFMGSGCTHVSGGHRIRPEMVSFIRPGLTTKQEVFETLGLPTLELEHGQLLAYAWETTGGIKFSLFVLGQEKAESGPKQTQWSFCVAFDGTARVSRHAIISIAEDEMFGDAVLKWHNQSP